MVLRARSGSQRDQVCARLQELLPAGAPWVRIPSHVTEDRLVGGVSLAATLREGKVVTERGLLDVADEGVLVLPMAERLQGGVVSHLCASLDGAVSRTRRFTVLALDEGIEDERIPLALADRLAFQLDLAAAEDGTPAVYRDPRRIDEARAAVAQVALEDGVVAALCGAAQALGVSSLRAAVMAALAARAHAALEGRARTEDVDAVVAARLVLGPRATSLPEVVGEAEERDATEGPAADQVEEESNAEDGADGAAPEGPEVRRAPARSLEEVVIQAAKSGIPAGVLDPLIEGREPRASVPRGRGRAGVLRASAEGGRPAGVRPGNGRDGELINLVETLRAAAPWQRLRSRDRRDAPQKTLVQVRRQDFRVTRYQRPTETSVIFSVDASGSAALQRLAEAKGAVEQVLADCYTRRDHVALVAFRGAGAALLLPPTRSLARVRRRLADLPGGGTTPLAAGIDAALTLALEARRQGRTPVLVLMTDGRANVARVGRQGGDLATRDALASSRAVRAASVRAIFLDTAPRPRAHARLLAQEMGARYLALPYLDTVGISRQVRSIAEGSR
jgi:magnesium chelatase subunit D